MTGTMKVTYLQEGTSVTTNLALDSSGNVTVGNNLTVSGTGNTSFSGNVGIGATPSAWFNAGNLQIGSYAALYTNTNLGSIELTSNSYRSAATTWNYTNSNYSTRYQQYDGTHRWYTAASGTAGNAITYTESMRIDSSGNLLVGTTVTNPIVSRTNGFATGPVGFLTLRGSNNMALGLSGTSGNHIQFYTDNGTTYVSAGSITSSGSTTSFTSSSDYRLKENVQPMTTGLSTIGALKPVTYNWIGDKSRGEGFIAHELQAVIPLAVTGEKDAVNDDGTINPQGVDYSKIVVHLVAALQEAVAKITALEDRITKLESGI